MHEHRKCWQRLEGLHIFHSKNSVNQLNIRGVCRCHASINLFWLRKILIALFVTKQYQPFCVRTGGDALMKLPCSGLLPSIEVGLCYLKKWRRRIITFCFKTSTVDVGERRTAPAALVKTAVRFLLELPFFSCACFSSSRWCSQLQHLAVNKIIKDVLVIDSNTCSLTRVTLLNRSACVSYYITCYCLYTCISNRIRIHVAYICKQYH